MNCQKCGAKSGDDWSQCKGSCPEPASPHYRPHLEMTLGATCVATASPRKRSGGNLTITLSPKHRAALESMAREEDMSMSQLISQALALYQRVKREQQAGRRLAFVTLEGRVVPPEVVGLPSLED